MAQDDLTQALNIANDTVQNVGQFSYDVRSQERYEQLVQEGRDWNLDMWHRQNEYNSPRAQVQRLIDAGLNPNLAYGQLQNFNPSAPQGQQEVSRQQYSQLQRARMMEFAMNAKQMSLIQSQIEQNAASSEKELALAKLYQSQKIGQDNENSVFSEKFDLFVKETNSKIGLNDSDANLKFNQGKVAYEDYVSKQLDNYFKSETMQDRIKQVQQQLNLTTEQVNAAKAAVSKAYAEISYLRKQGQYIDAKIITESVQRNYLNSLTNLSDAQKEQVLADKTLKNQMEKYYVELVDKTAQDRRVGEAQEESIRSRTEWERTKTGQNVGGILGEVQMGMVGAVEVMGSLF